MAEGQTPLSLEVFFDRRVTGEDDQRPVTGKPSVSLF